MLPVNLEVRQGKSNLDSMTVIDDVIGNGHDLVIYVILRNTAIGREAKVGAEIPRSFSQYTEP